MAKILAVDDARTMRELVRSILEAEGHEVVVAEDGVKAIEFARGNAVDLVLTDINMPNMNGISLVTKLRLLADYENTPIIMLTTESSDYKKTKARNMGADAWLQKPFDPARLLKAVNTMLERVGK